MTLRQVLCGRTVRVLQLQGEGACETKDYGYGNNKRDDGGGS